MFIGIRQNYWQYAMISLDKHTLNIFLPFILYKSYNFKSFNGLKHKVENKVEKLMPFIAYSLLMNAKISSKIFNSKILFSKIRVK